MMENTVPHAAPVWFSQLISKITSEMVGDTSTQFGELLKDQVAQGFAYGMDAEELRMPFLIDLQKRSLARLGNKTTPRADLCRKSVQSVIDLMQSQSSSDEVRTSVFSGVALVRDLVDSSKELDGTDVIAINPARSAYYSVIGSGLMPTGSSLLQYEFLHEMSVSWAAWSAASSSGWSESSKLSLEEWSKVWAEIVQIELRAQSQCLLELIKECCDKVVPTAVETQ